MSLMVSIIKSPDSVNITESTKNFESLGGTIGRGNDNTWALEDPERYLSTCHCQISNENGQYFITDLSTNGTFYNGSANPIGKGSRLPLNDGDSFIVGDYEFSVSYSNPGGAEAPLMDNLSSDPFAANTFDSAFSDNDNFAQSLEPSNDPFASAHASASEPLFTESPAETDPLAALDKAQGRNDMNAGFNSASDPFEAPGSSSSFSDSSFSDSSFSDQANPVSQQISWPEAVPEQGSDNAGAIPDDWDMGFNESEPVQPASLPNQSIPLTVPPVVPVPGQVSQQVYSSDNFQQNAPIQPEAESITNQQHDSMLLENAKMKVELEQLKQQLSTQQAATNTDVTVDTSLIDSLGMQKHKLNDAEIIKINQLAGEVIREMIKGLMQVLGSRGSIKNEFRMHVTTIQPVENNPIKFSANVDDALENMFVKQGNAYKKPVESVQEGFDSVAEHQIAILAGIKSAFKGVIERFDPALLEERFSKLNKGSFIPGSQKAKNWDLYHEYYNELAGDIDNSFQFLFGDDFVRAYEDQLQKMTIAKKAERSTTGK